MFLRLGDSRDPALRLGAVRQGGNFLPDRLFSYTR